MWRKDGWKEGGRVIVESVKGWIALLMCIDSFCLGGSCFAHNERTKAVLRVLVIVLGIIIMSAS